MLQTHAPFNLLLNAAAIEQSKSLDQEEKVEECQRFCSVSEKDGTYVRMCLLNVWFLWIDTVSTHYYHYHSTFTMISVEMKSERLSIPLSSSSMSSSSSTTSFAVMEQVRSKNAVVYDYPQSEFSSFQTPIVTKSSHLDQASDATIGKPRQCAIVKKGHESKGKTRRIETAADEKMELDILRWYERYQELCQYKKEHGDCLVPQHYESNPQLGMWVSNQRRLKSKTKKTPIVMERIEALDAIGFIWNSKVALKGKKLSRRRPKRANNICIDVM